MYKKPIAILFSDTHLFERTSKYGTPLADNFSLNSQVFKKVRELSTELKVDYIFHLGDAFDFKRHQSQDTLLYFQGILDEFAYDKKYLHIIPGNNDKVNESSNDSYLTPFIDHPHLILHQSPELLKIDDIDFYFLPYYKEQIYIEKLSKLILDSNRKKVLLTHQSFNGIEDNDKHVISNGIVVDHMFDAVFSGHIHKRNRYLPETPHYIGGAIPHNFGEYEDKGVTVLYDDLTIKFIPLSLIHYTTLDCNVTTIDYVYSQAISLRKQGVMVRINFTGTEIERQSLKAYNWNKHGIKFIYNRLNSQKAGVTDLNIESELDLMKMFDDFCESKKIINKEKGLSYLL